MMGEKRDPRREWLEAAAAGKLPRYSSGDASSTWNVRPVSLTREQLDSLDVAVFRGRATREMLNRRIGDPFEEA